jgi:hypothetical protein
VSESSVVDKHGLLDGGVRLKLDLGCGSTKRGAEYVGIDLADGSGVDVVGDVVDVLRTIGDASVVEVFSSHLFEHVDNLSALLGEIERVLEVGGTLRAVVPHFSNPYHHSDPTHRRTFGLYTFSYYAEDHLLRRRVPTYGHRPRLRLERVRLGFRSAIELPGRHLLKAGLNRIVNSSPLLMELYEANLAWILPSYELEYVLVKTS